MSYPPYLIFYALTILKILYEECVLLSPTCFLFSCCSSLMSSYSSQHFALGGCHVSFKISENFPPPVSMMVELCLFFVSSHSSDLFGQETFLE